MDALLSVEDVAKLTNLSTSAVSNYAKAGRITAMRRVGRTYVFTHAAVAEVQQIFEANRRQLYGIAKVNAERAHGEAPDDATAARLDRIEAQLAQVTEQLRVLSGLWGADTGVAQ